MSVPPFGAKVVRPRGIGIRRVRGNVVDLAREAEVENLDAVVRQHDDVVRLQVAVHDTAFVRRGQPTRHLAGVVGGLAHRKRTAGEHVGRRSSLGQFHDEEQVSVPTLLRFFQTVDLRDVRMIERGERLRLTLESGQPVGVVRHGCGQHLDGHRAFEAEIVGAVDLAHAAAPSAATIS